MNYTALKAEIANDPVALGYNGTSDQAAADLINLVRAGASFQVNSAPVSAALFFSKLDPTEYQALTQLKYLQLQNVLSAAPIDLSDASTQGILLGIFNAAPISKAALTAIVKRQASRAEVLLGRGVVVTADDVHNARIGAW